MFILHCKTLYFISHVSVRNFFFKVMALGHKLSSGIHASFTNSLPQIAMTTRWRSVWGLGKQGRMQGSPSGVLSCRLMPHQCRGLAMFVCVRDRERRRRRKRKSKEKKNCNQFMLLDISVFKTPADTRRKYSAYHSPLLLLPKKVRSITIGVTGHPLEVQKNGFDQGGKGLLTDRR